MTLETLKKANELKEKIEMLKRTLKPLGEFRLDALDVMKTHAELHLISDVYALDSSMPIDIQIAKSLIVGEYDHKKKQLEELEKEFEEL